VSEGAIRKRAAREGWTKRDFAARATPWPRGRAPGAGVGAAPPPDEAGTPEPGTPEPGSLAATEARILERWKASPFVIQPNDLARKALAGAAHALKAGEGLNALRLARAAAEIARLDGLFDWAIEDVAETEAQVEARHEIMQMFLRERALSLAEDIVAGRPLPPEFDALKDHLARLAAAAEARTQAG
jgi:hypothetical protein